MSRKQIAPNVQTNVLVGSRRRCCICFGLSRDTNLKSGQIAHLDRNNANNVETNLAFLCFNHHDDYDSRASQRKNFTIGEVKQFRSELYQTINRAFSQPVHFGEILTPPHDPYAGQYIRLGESVDSAEISFTPLPDSIEAQMRYFISGFALWGIDRPSGPNMGILEFVGEISDENTMVYTRCNGNGVVTTKLFFGQNGALDVEEDNWVGEYGMNVSFIGTYKRAGLSQ